MKEDPSQKRSNLLLALGAAAILIGAAVIIVEVRRTQSLPIGALVAMLVGALVFSAGVRRGGGGG